MLRYFLNNYRLPILITFVIIIVGILNFTTIKREAFPNVNFASAKIITIYPGASSEDVELLITKKIEDSIKKVSSIKQISSVSQEGYSEINVQLDIDNIDVQSEMLDLQSAVNNTIDLPDDLDKKPIFTEIKTSEMPVLEFGISSSTEERGVIQNFADKLEDTINLIDGVSSVRKVGFLDKNISVVLKLENLIKYNVGINEVTQAIKNHNTNVPGSNLLSSSDNKEIIIRLNNKTKTIEEISSLVVRTNMSGKFITISDLAFVKYDYEKPDIITKINGEQGIVFVVSKSSNQDIIRLSQKVKDKVNEFKKILPENINISISNDESIRTSNRLNIVADNSILGFVLLLVAALCFLNFTTSLVTSFSVPIVILMTFVMMSWMGITLNVISMLAIVIALGMFVDNSIVITENIYRLIQKGVPTKEACYRGVKELILPLTATVLTTISAFTPMLVTKGILGQFIWSIPIIVSFSLVFSLLESFYLLPSRIILLNKKESTKSNNWFDKINITFAKLLRFCLHRKYKVLSILTIILFSTFFLGYLKLGFVLFPSEGVDRFVVKYSANQGTPIKELHKAVFKVEQNILDMKNEGVENIITRTGIQQVTPSDPLSRNGNNVGMIIVYLNNENERALTASQIMSKLRESTPIYEPLTELTFEDIANGPPVGRPVTITLKGNDFEKLKEISDKVISNLKDIEGIKNIASDLNIGLPEYKLVVKNNVSKKYGLNPNIIANQVYAAIEGLNVSKVNDFKKDINITVSLDKINITNSNFLEKIKIQSPNGQLIPLSQLVTVNHSNGEITRKHFDFQRSVTITAGVDMINITSSVANAKINPYLKNIMKDYSGYSYKVGGEEESSNDSIESLGNAMILAILGIFTILVATLKSFVKPFMILITIPFSFIGPILGFIIHGKSFGFIAMIGIIGLTGVVINAAIILIAVIDSLRENKNILDSIVDGSCMRLRPIVLTTLTTVAALLPTAYGVGGFDPILVPMTLAMAWGLLFGTIIILFIIPCTYLASDEISKKISKYFYG